MRRSLRGITLSDRWFNRLVIGAVTLGFVLLVAVGFIATSTILQNQEQTRWVNHSYGVQRAIGRYRGLTERAEAVRRGLLLRSDSGFYDTFYRTTAEIEVTPTIAAPGHRGYLARASGRILKFPGWLQVTEGQQEFAGEDEAAEGAGDASAAGAGATAAGGATNGSAGAAGP